MAEYQSGTCNINQQESKKRYLTGGLSLVTGLIFSFAYVWLSSPSYMMAFAFIAYATGFLGILQGRENFCVKHARKGTQKTGEETEEVQDEEKVEEDKTEANKIIIQSILLGATITIWVYLANIYLF